MSADTKPIEAARGLALRDRAIAYAGIIAKLREENARLTAALAEAEGEYDRLCEVANELADRHERLEAEAATAQAALAEAEGERDQARRHVHELSETALRAQDEHGVLELAQRLAEAEADAATGRAVARRYRDGWAQSSAPYIDWTPEQFAYLASLSDEPT